MRRSISSNNISNSTTFTTTNVVVPRRNFSVPASLYMIMTDIVTEIQIESVTHTPAYIAGLCMASTNMPLSILNSASLDSDDEIHNIGACMACEIECPFIHEEEDPLCKTGEVRRRKVEDNKEME